MRIRPHVGGVVVAVILALALSAVPAAATVHEIVAQWCSGHEPLEPPGISRSGSRNFAQPLNATLMAVPIELDAAANVVTPATATALFQPNLSGSPQVGFNRQYDVSSDNRFLVDTAIEVTLPVTVILNWAPEP